MAFFDINRPTQQRPTSPAEQPAYTPKPFLAPAQGPHAFVVPTGMDKPLLSQAAAKAAAGNGTGDGSGDGPEQSWQRSGQWLQRGLAGMRAVGSEAGTRSGQSNILGQQYHGRVAPTVDAFNAYGAGQQSALDAAAAGAGGRQLGTEWTAWNRMGEDPRNRAMGAGDLMGGAAFGQGAAGNALLALGMQPQGPSAAEAAMRRTAEDARLGIASQTAGARGDAIGLAMREGAAAQADIGAQLSQDVGIQRLNEDIAWDAARQNALGAAAGAYGGMGGTLGGQADVYGGVRAGDTSVAQQYADFTMGEAGLNDAMTLGLLGEGSARGLGYTQAGTQQAGMYGGLGQGQDQIAQGYLGQAGAMYGGIAGEGGSTQRTHLSGIYGVEAAATEPPTNWSEMLAGAALTAGGAVVGGMMGGPAGAVAGGAAGASAAKSSDIRGKTAIQPAGGAVDQAYRGIGASSYEYRDPTAPGAAPGRHVGPMAQELAAHPATAGAVVRGPGGMLGVDPGRLTLTNTSELAQQRRDIDRLVSHQATMSQLDDAERRYTEALTGQPTPRPTPQAPAAPDAGDEARRRAGLALAGAFVPPPRGRNRLRGAALASSAADRGFRAGEDAARALRPAEQASARQVQALRQLPTASYPQPAPPPQFGPQVPQPMAWNPANGPQPTAAYLGMPGPIAGRY